MRASGPSWKDRPSSSGGRPALVALSFLFSQLQFCSVLTLITGHLPGFIDLSILLPDPGCFCIALIILFVFCCLEGYLTMVVTGLHESQARVRALHDFSPLVPVGALGGRSYGYPISPRRTWRHREVQYPPPPIPAGWRWGLESTQSECHPC